MGIRLRLGSLFDGIGGFPLSAVRNGILPVWASEIEPFPIQVTKQMFPEMLHVGDITKLKGTELPAVDIITGGSPCQDLSIAGKRAGLSGERSGLFMEQIRIVKEMRKTDAKRQRGNETANPCGIVPRFMVWENVPGAFSSSNGEDFRAVLEEICRIADHTVSVPRPPAGRWKSAGAILGSGFSVAWRVLDAQYWGVPQRRKRIFLVADFGGTSAPEILFKQESLPGYPAQISRTGQGASGETQRSAGDPGGDQIDTEGFMAFHINQREETIDLGQVSGALMATRNMQMQTFIAGFPDQQKEPTLCLNDQGGQVMDCSVDVAGTLRAQMSGHPPLVFDNHGQDLRFTGPVEKAQAVTASYGMGGNTQSLVLFENHGIDGRYTGPLPVSPTLSARSGTGGNNLPLIAEEPDSYCIAGNIIDRESKNGGNGFGYQEDISYTLNTADRHAVYSRQFGNYSQERSVASTECARQYKDATDLVCQPGVDRNLIRRLTPLECERLQGFPDGWTLIDGASDSARYKALGNSVAIPCVTFVLRGIVLIMEKEFAEEQKN